MQIIECKYSITSKKLENKIRIKCKMAAKIFLTNLDIDHRFNVPDIDEFIKKKIKLKPVLDKYISFGVYE